MKKVLKVQVDKASDSTEVTIRVPGFENFGQRLEALERKSIEAMDDEPPDPEMLSSAVAKLNAITEQALKKMPEGPQKEMLLKLMKETDEAGLDDDDEEYPELEPRKEKPVDLQELAVCLPDGMKWDKAAEAIVDQFLSDWPKLRPGVLKETAKYYKKHYPDLLEFLGDDASTRIILPKPGSEQVVDLFRVSTIYVREDGGIGISGHCTWDDEHGFGAVLKKGKIEVGQASDAYGG
jgi:hypothetical protein